MLHKHPDGISITTKHYDILLDINHMIQKLGIEVKFQWVKGHQSDEHIQNNQLARMNDIVDSIAKSYARYCMKHPYEQASLVYGQQYWSIRCQGEKIVNHLDKRIAYHIHVNELFGHLQNKYDLNDAELQSIDWHAIK